MKYSSPAEAEGSAKVTRGVALPALAGAPAARGAAGVTTAGTVAAGVGATEGGCVGAGRRNWFAGNAAGAGRAARSAGASSPPTPARMLSSRSSASIAPASGCFASEGLLRLTPPAAAAAFLANMLASLWRSFLSAFSCFAFLASPCSSPPFLRFLPSAASSSSSDAPGCAVVQSSSSPRSTYLSRSQGERDGMSGRSSVRGGTRRKRDFKPRAQRQSGTAARETGNLKAIGSGGHVLIAFFADDETAVLLAALVGELGVLLLGHLRCVAEKGSGGGSGRMSARGLFWHPCCWHHRGI